MFLRAVSIPLSYALDRDWDLEEETKGWGVGERLLVPLFGEVENALADA